METPPTPRKVYRVQGIPIDWDSERLKEFLEKHHPSSEFAIKSLSRELNSNISSATVDFHGASIRLGISLSESLGPTEGRPSVITIDEDFLGITTLYAPQEENHKINIIAVPGLGGHAFGSFKERNKGQDNAHMWLRDKLPHDITMQNNETKIARVMIYGYDSKVPGSNSFQDLRDLATSLRSSLRYLTANVGTKPIIFISHSMGGLVVKEMLISVLRSSNKEDRQIAKATCGVVFFGVPHAGMNVTSIIQMAGDGPNRCLVDSLNQSNNDPLAKQADFRESLKDRDDIQIACFYETVKSPTAQQDENGTWSMSGPSEILVEKDSAIIRDSGIVIECAINREHSEMVKFKSNDAEYTKALEVIRSIVYKALARPRNCREISACDFACWHEKDLDQDFPGRHFWYRETIGQNGYPTNVTVDPQFLTKSTRPIGQSILTLRRVCNIQIRGHVKGMDPGRYRLIWFFWFFAGRDCPSSSQSVPSGWIPKATPANSVYERSFTSVQGPNSAMTPDSGWFYPWDIRCSAGQVKDSVDFLYQNVDVQNGTSMVTMLLASGYEERVIDMGLWNTLRNTGWCEVPGPSINIGSNGELFLVISKDYYPKWIGGFSFGGVRIEPIE